MRISLLIIVIIASTSIGVDQAYALCNESDGPPEPCFDSFKVSNEKITEKWIMNDIYSYIQVNYDSWEMSDRIFENSLEAYDLPDIICTEFVVDGVKQYRMAQWLDEHKISDWENHYDPSLCFKWFPPISNSMPIPEPEPFIIINGNCGPGTILQDEICIVTSESKSTDTFEKSESPYRTLPQPNLRASCTFDGVIAMWFYQFIVNPLCEMGIQIIPDYECNCDI